MVHVPIYIASIQSLNEQNPARLAMPRNVWMRLSPQLMALSSHILPAEEEPASAVEPSAMADAVEENSVAPLRTAPSPPERKEASNAAVVSAEPGREDALASTPQGKPVDLPISSKEMCSDDPPKRKRLGWGQGLARLQSKDARASGIARIKASQTQD